VLEAVEFRPETSVGFGGVYSKASTPLIGCNYIHVSLA